MYCNIQGVEARPKSVHVLLLTVRLVWYRRVTLQHEFSMLPSVDQPRCSVAILGRDDRLGPLRISFLPISSEV